MYYIDREKDKRYIKLREQIQQWGNYLGTVYDEPCDEEAAKNDLLAFYDLLRKCKPDKRICIGERSYYAYMINLLPFQQALHKGKYSLACHELETLFVSHPILQPRIYYNLLRLEEKYLDEEAEYESQKKDAEFMSDTEDATVNPLIMGGSGCGRCREWFK